ncbi:MAG: hypothetical protein Q8O67_20750 [Deltaproteobacteria bacterium]|nr:hypothetical protein [Deltaproteobacteria bacterium]
MKKLAALALVSAVVVVALTSCTTPPATPDTSRRSTGLTLAEAKTVVTAFESRQVAPQKAIAASADLKAALDVLKTDRIDAFPATVGWLETQSGYDALALKAQILLAWGEAELTVAEVMAQTATQLEQNLRGWEVRKNLSDADKKKIASEKERIDIYRETDEALRLLAAEHVGQGAEDADKVIGEKPGDYVGYRIAADAARLRNQWTDFTANVAKVEAAKPDSNGLKFLRGVEAYMRDGDAREAAQHFREALAADPEFVRAQAQLVLVAPNVFEQHKELMSLKKIAPDHQIVRWAGPGIELAHTAARERQQAIQNAITSRPSGGTTNSATNPN